MYTVYVLSRLLKETTRTGGEYWFVFDEMVVDYDYATGRVRFKFTDLYIYINSSRYIVLCDPNQ